MEQKENQEVKEQDRLYHPRVPHPIPMAPRRSRHEGAALSKSFGIRSQISEDPDLELPFRPLQGQKLFRILLVRHAQSLANVDKSILTKMADHVIDISEEGRQQAREAGKQIRQYYEGLMATGEFQKGSHVRLWCSPYKRTRETAKIIQEETGQIVTDMRENIFFGEQQFGLFEGVPLDQISTKYPQEYEHFQKCIAFGGRFWARMPLGESRFDVAKRVYDSFGTFHRDAENHSITDLIIVTHGVAMRAFVMMWLHLTPEWFETEPNPNNCAVRLLDSTRDGGYIFDGFPEAAVTPHSRLHSNASEKEANEDQKMFSQRHS